MGQLAQSLWSGWKTIAAKIGHIQTRVMLLLFYYLCMWPVAVGLRLLADPLGLKTRSGGTRWQRRDRRALSLDEARRQ